jgi:hypothetical protein
VVSGDCRLVRGWWMSCLDSFGEQRNSVCGQPTGRLSGRPGVRPGPDPIPLGETGVDRSAEVDRGGPAAKSGVVLVDAVVAQLDPARALGDGQPRRVPRGRHHGRALASRALNAHPLLRHPPTTDECDRLTTATMRRPLGNMTRRSQYVTVLTRAFDQAAARGIAALAAVSSATNSAGSAAPLWRFRGPTRSRPGSRHRVSIRRHRSWYQQR